MIPCLVIAIAACYGFWFRHLRYSVGYKLNSDKVDGTTKDVCSILVDDISSPCTMEDHISELPHEILSYIFSFLSVRDVARIATLSKKLMTVCLALPYINFDRFVLSSHPKNFYTDLCEKYQVAFVNNVDQFLKWYRSPETLSFRLSFCLSKVYARDVDRWINFAATKKDLESLKLEFICSARIGCQLKRDDLHTISSSFISQFLRLKYMNLFTCILKVQNNVRLNSLVTLDLNYVLLEGTQWECFLSGFPTIQWLRLKYCNLPEKICIRYGFLRLTSLMIHNCVELLELELNASSLKTFEFTGTVALRHCGLNAPQLKNVFVWLRNPGGGDYLLCNIAKSASGLKSLILRGSCFMIHKLPSHPSTFFRSVLRLHLSSRYDDWNVDIVKALPLLLKSFPLLEKLYVKLPYHPSQTYHPSQRGHWSVLAWKYDPSSCYYHYKLNEIELSEFCSAWMEFALYLLRSATALNRMVINRTLKDYWGCGRWMSCRRSGFNYDDWNRVKRSREALLNEAISPSVDVLFVSK